MCFPVAQWFACLTGEWKVMGSTPGGGGGGGTAQKIAFTPRLCHTGMSKVSKAIFDHTFDHF